MLDPTLQTQLRGALELLRHPIRVSAWLDDSLASAETRALLADLARASSQIDIVELQDGGDEHRPSFAIHRPDEAPRVRFAGLPLGHEFTSLVLALLHVGGHPPKHSDDLLAQARALPGPLAFVTYFSQSCQNCPDLVQALNLLAALNPGVSHVAIDGGVFEAEVAERQVMAVPTVFLNGEPFGQGRMTLADVLGKLATRLDAGAAQRQVDELDARPAFDMLIVGGGPAGAAAAIYAARKGIRTGIVTERFGGQVLDTLAIENFISVSETDGPRFAAALEAHVRHYPVDLIESQRAKRLIPGDASESGLIEVELDSGATLRAHSVILATGARWRNMNVPGEEDYRTRGVTYCPHCDGPLFKGKRVAVIGGGNSGAEAAIDLAGVVEHVTLIEFMDELKADAILQDRLRSLANVEILTSTRTTEVLGDGARVIGIELEDRSNNGSRRKLAVEGVFVQIGLLPNTGWLGDTVELSATGEIVIDGHGRTNVPGVFAAGDATTVPFKQIIIATGDGAKAALGAFDYLIRRPSVDSSSPGSASAA